MTANYMLKKESKKTNCHSGLDPESSARAHNTKAYHASGCPIGSGMTGERGRSMIEMLGVLAIIGVLSVGGIAGYTSAMNKHRANELLYQASMRATTCAAQIAMGSTPNVDDFDDYDGYHFAAASTGQNEFTMTITGTNSKTISEAVCNNMKNALPSDVRMTTPETCASSNATIVLTYEDGKGVTINVPPANLCEGVSCTGCQACNPSNGLCENTCLSCQECDSSTNKCIDTCGSGKYCASSGCEDSLIGKSCGDFSPDHSLCGGDAPFCHFDPMEGSTCQADIEGAACSSHAWCQSHSDVYKYCGFSNDGQPSGYGCRSTLSGASCSEISDCDGSDAPYCLSVDETCSKWFDYGALCDSTHPCTTGYYCNNGSCDYSFIGIDCSDDPYVCGNDAPYCVAGRCSQNQ